MVTRTLETLQRAERALKMRIHALEFQLNRYPTATREKSDLYEYKTILLDELKRIQEQKAHAEK